MEQEQPTLVQKIDHLVGKEIERSQNLPLTHPALPRTPLQMLEHAVMTGAGIEVIERLEALHERWERNQNRRAFYAALAAAKADLPMIVKDRLVGYDSTKPGARRTSYKHASLAEIVRDIQPALSAHGLWARFRTSSEPNEPITVTCIIGHADGHAEENTLKAARDDSQGTMNTLQRIGSTITYLSRYTLMAALGLAAAEDDDGAAATTAIGPEQLAELKHRLTEAGVVEANFKKFFGIPTLEDLPDHDWQRALDEIAAFKERKAAKPKESAGAAGQP